MRLTKSFFKATRNATESPLFNFTNENLLYFLSPYEAKKALESYKGGKYLKLNAYLREDKGLPKDLMSLALGLDKSLYTLPIYKGEVYRTLGFANIFQFENFIKEWVPSKIVTNKAYTSASKGKLYNDLSNVKYGALLKLKSINGRDMAGIGLYEAEILFPRNTKFKINQVQRNENIFFATADEI